jgi:integrase
MSKRTPSYCLHKATGQAVVRIDGRDYYLGKYDSPESRAEYNRLIAEWYANGQRLFPPQHGHDGGQTVNDLILGYWSHVQTHYRHPDGTPTSEVAEYRLTLRVLKELYGHTAARDFGPLALKVVRQKIVDAGLSRNVVNQRAGRVKRLFRWAVENELIPANVYHGLLTVRGLERGRSEARETDPVGPVSKAAVNETLPYLNRHVRGIVQVQLFTGARPGEVCLLRAFDIDMTGNVWLYRPHNHKTAHRGHQRIIAIGPKAQAILKAYLTLDTEAYLFSPRRAMEERRVEMRKNRKTRVQPSQQNRRKRLPKKGPTERYTTSSYAHAVRTACRKAGIEPWHPHQLRHTRATELRREFGLDTARTVLGHRSPQITETYAELDIGKATEVMAKLG